MLTDTTALLNERHYTHGRFADNARFGQALRTLFRTSHGWESMSAEHREALDHIAGKLSRILSGQAAFKDHWADLAGYSELGKDSCEQ